MSAVIKADLKRLHECTIKEQYGRVRLVLVQVGETEDGELTRSSRTQGSRIAFRIQELLSRDIPSNINKQLNVLVSKDNASKQMSNLMGCAPGSFFIQVDNKIPLFRRDLIDRFYVSKDFVINAIKVCSQEEMKEIVHEMLDIDSRDLENFEFSDSGVTMIDVFPSHSKLVTFNDTTMKQ
jgi:hypothetical protein